jgi:toluene monooxygenase system protein B
MNVVAEKVAHHAVGLRVASQDAAKRVYYNGKEVPPETTIANSGIQPMDWIEVGYVE